MLISTHNYITQDVRLKSNDKQTPERAHCRLFSNRTAAQCSTALHNSTAKQAALPAAATKHVFQLLLAQQPSSAAYCCLKTKLLHAHKAQKR
jgi:hypothetical protein